MSQNINSTIEQSDVLGKSEQKKIAIIVRCAPYGQSLAQEAMDAILAISLYCEHISVVFIGDGVFQLLANQKSQLIDNKSIEKQLQAFSLYDIEQVLICQQSLNQRNLTMEQLSVNENDVKVLDKTALNATIRAHDSLLTF